MEFILASDSFKGSLSSNEVNNIFEKAVNKIFPGSNCTKISIADGGEGTLDAIMQSSTYYERVFTDVSDPLGRKITKNYLIHGKRAIIEMAEASGLTLVKKEEMDIYRASSFGTGELIREAIKNGAREIYIGIGGCATNDGGMGAMKALGYRFLDSEKNELVGNATSLGKVKYIDDSDIIKELSDTKITVMCDVTNRLTGPMGATYVYGPQKGGTKEDLDIIEEGMKNFEQVLEDYSGKDVRNIDGLGAAGGLGASLCVFLNAEIKSGIDVLLDLNCFEKKLENVDIVLTGEGRTDYQSECGKVIYGISKRAKEKNVPVFVISGSLMGNLEGLYDVGVCGMEAAVCSIIKLDEAMKNAEEYLLAGVERMLRTLQAGMNLNKN